jgi:hypothetical protein
MDYTSNMLEENQPSSLEPVFLEHPSNTLVNYQPSVVKCVVRNSAQTDIICDGQKRNDVIRKKNLADGSETLSILVRQKDFLDKQKTTCRCIAISNIYNDQIFSNEAILGKACKFQINFSAFFYFNIFNFEFTLSERFRR